MTLSLLNEKGDGNKLKKLEKHLQEPLWKPDENRIRNTNLTSFINDVEKDWNIQLGNFEKLYDFSIKEQDKFWISLINFTDLIAETWGNTVQKNPGCMPGTKFFPNAQLNFAENLLRRRDNHDAIVFNGENRVFYRLTYADLYNQVSKLRQALISHGLSPGDRVAGYLPNIPEAVIAMLATTSIGAVWSSCSPDFGTQGVLERFGQIKPKIFFAAEGYYYNGKSHDCLGKIGEILQKLPSVIKTIIISYTCKDPKIDNINNAIMLGDMINQYTPVEIQFEHFNFNHPLYIMYSSGTTGAPKCIVHSAGGTLLQHVKEHQLHCDIKKNDRVFYFTTCGWMMWNWLVTALASKATLILYDGSPFFPNGNTLFDFADTEKITLFGTSAKFIDTIIKEKLDPISSHSLDSIRVICSTGSPLAPEAFNWVYKHIKKDVHLASIAGGTDLLGCFMLGNPTGPVWKGEIQTRALAMAVEVFDNHGKSINQEKGELVCTLPFPSMPIEFYGDVDGSKYRNAYFERFNNTWCHGDYVEITKHGGIIIYGRSDATLNPGGVRIGTAEIYREVERLEQIIESVVVGQEWKEDIRIVLFVILNKGLRLSEELTNLIKYEIRKNCTPRHTPSKIIQVTDIPRTKSGKITELAVREIIHGREVKNKEALANPKSLELFHNLPELMS